MQKQPYLVWGSESDVGVRRGRRTEVGVWAQSYPSAPRVPRTCVYTITQNLSASLWTKSLTSPFTDEETEAQSPEA